MSTGARRSVSGGVHGPRGHRVLPFFVIRRFLTGLASNKPVALVIDDLHGANDLPHPEVNGVFYDLCGNAWFKPCYGANGLYYRVVPARGDRLVRHIGELIATARAQGAQCSGDSWTETAC